MVNRNLKLSLIFEILCFVVLVILELQGHLKLTTVLVPLGLLLMAVILLSLAHDFHGFAQKLCIALGILLYPFCFYLFSQLGVPTDTKFHLLLFFIVRLFIGLWLHYYEQLRRWFPLGGRDILLVLILSLYFGLAANVLRVHTVNLFEHIQYLKRPRLYAFDVNLFLIYTAVHAFFSLCMSALRKFQ